MKTSARPELREPVHAFAAKLIEGVRTIPLSELASLFGAPAGLLDRVAGRGDLVFREDVFSNAGPELVLAAGAVELELPDLIRGNWTARDGGFDLSFPSADFAPRACAKVAFFRKCFELKEMRATTADLTLDFGNDLANRRYTF